VVAEDGYLKMSSQEEVLVEQEGDVVIETVGDLKRAKATAKTGFTKVRRYLLTLIQKPDVSREAIEDSCGELDHALERAMEVMENLASKYKIEKDHKNEDKLSGEIEQIELEYSDAQNRAQNVMDILSNPRVYDKFLRVISHREEVPTERIESHQTPPPVLRDSDREVPPRPPVSSGYNTNLSHVSTDSALIGLDMWKQLKRVTLPVFSGDKRTYQNWKAAFTACVDKAPATAEYKLLQLRECLAGVALKTIEGLGHSATAYETAKERLERKFGGQRRQVALYLEEVDNFRPISPDNFRDLEKFADLLDITIVNLKEADRSGELNDGLLYMKLQKKIPAKMLANYHRWVFEKHKRESVETLREWVIQEAEFQTRALEVAYGFSTSRPGKFDAKKFKKESTYSYFGKSHTKSDVSVQRPYSSRTCRVCNGPHGVWACPEFKHMNTQIRWECAKQNKLCFRCLGEGHQGQFCDRTRVCGINNCKEVHHRLLHSNSSQSPSTASGKTYETVNEKTQSPRPQETKVGESSVRSEGETKEADSSYTTVTAKKGTSGTIALRTIPVYLRNGVKRMKVNALLDDASTKTYINSDVAAELGLQGCLQQVNVSVLNGHVETFQTSPVECTIESLDGKSKLSITAFTAEKVTGDLRAIDWNTFSRQWPHLQKLEFPKLGSKPTVDVLIGLDCTDLHYSFKDVRGAPGQPVARLTPLGWTCIGNAGNSEQINTNFAYTYFSADQQDMEKINSMMMRFWEIETTGVEKVEVFRPDEKAALRVAEKSITHNGECYKIAIPWKDKFNSLPNNIEMAERRLQNLERRLSKQPDVAEEYSKIIDGHLKKGYITKLPPIENDNKTKWYLPHFPVVKKTRSTTKVRIVFDASARYNGIALNDVIFQGPKLQNNLFDVLLRFRRYPVALACDIAEMYLRIELDPKDRTCHRFLWRDMDVSRKPEKYEFNRLVFGINSSPFLAQFVSQFHAKQHEEQFPRAAEVILKSTYMDDSMDSVVDGAQGVKLYTDLSRLWAKAGMRTHKWVSNSSTVLQSIPPQHRASEMTLDSQETSPVKTLGILWCAVDDVFTFKSQCCEKEFVFTKRNFLKRIATIFDPLGMLSPYVIRGKMLMQDIWICGTDWDDPLPDDISTKVKSWFEELIMLSRIMVPRCIQPRRDVTSITLHVFVDASQSAYGAVTYLRSECENGDISVRFVASKTRVAPLQSLSIPRLELMGAILGKRLALSISSTMSINKSSLTFWTDSSGVLWWIRGHSRHFKPFVANRIGEIQAETSPERWRYVPTNDNPADYLTRGTTLDELSQLRSWWEGPAFLFKDEAYWPQLDKIDAQDKVVEELKKGCVLASVSLPLESFTAVMSTCKESWRLNPNRYSCWRELTRVRAWVLRFINNCRQVCKDNLTRGELRAEEVSDAENDVIKEMQMETYKEEYTALVNKRELSLHSKLLGLYPRLDGDGIIRSNGRLTYAEFLPYDVRYPVILPRKNWVTKLIVKHYHELGNHQAGTNHTLSLLSTRFWIVSAREEIREWEKECMMCRRLKAKVAQQIMAPLPLHRMTISLRAFTKTAVDFGGPFTTIQGRGKPRQKRYLCLFTCLSTRAVHLEMAYGLDVDSFLNALNRMMNRRGVPSEIVSDNGTNFVAANKELCELVCKDQRVQSSTTSKGIKWKFNPPYAPHFGGVFEIMIKSAKRAIMAILKDADVNDEELMTAFTGAEALINSRPLTYQSAEVKDSLPLTPNHFLHGQMGGQFAPEEIDEVTFNPKKRWRRVQELIRHYWHRWMREWLPSLSPRQKWFKIRKDVKPGDVVLVISPDTVRGQWPLGRILEVYPGKDGKVRTVKVQVGDRQYSRPIVKVCPLELD